MNYKRIFYMLIIGIFIGLTGLIYCFYWTANTDKAVISTDNLDTWNDDADTGEAIVNNEALDIIPMDSQEIVKEEPELLNNKIFVQICGEVKNPNVYQVEDGARVIEIIQLAGGFTNEAAGDYVNQAGKTRDGQKIYIPSKSDVEGKSYYESILSSDQDINNIESLKEDSGKGLVNINTADMDELMSLTGIGQAKAKSIIDYRDANGKFQTIEELKNIEGIKDGVYQKIRDFIITD